MEGIWNSELEKPLNAQNLMDYCGSLKDRNAERDAENGSLACEVSGEAKTLLQPFLWYFESRTCSVWSAGAEESVVISKRSESLK